MNEYHYIYQSLETFEETYIQQIQEVVEDTRYYSV